MQRVVPAVLDSTHKHKVYLCDFNATLPAGIDLKTLLKEATTRGKSTNVEGEKKLAEKKEG